MADAERHWRTPLHPDLVLDDTQTQRVRDLRSQARSPAEIARAVGVPVDVVRSLLEAEGILDRPAATVEPLADRPRVARDLLTPAEARQHLGVDASTLRAWARQRGLPYRDAVGAVTDKPYDGRWCVFSCTELDRWVAAQRA